MSVTEKKHSQELFEDRLIIAKGLGWVIGENFIEPPRHFECSQNDWAAIREVFKYQGKDILVPHWFWDNHVLVFGTWK